MEQISVAGIKTHRENKSLPMWVQSCTKGVGHVLGCQPKSPTGAAEDSYLTTPSWIMNPNL